MPVHCDIRLPRISDDEMRVIDYRVTKHAFSTHRDVGCLADECVYQRELQRHLALDNIDGLVEVPVHLSFRTLSIPLKLDLVVQEKVIYELKAVSALSHRHESQLLSYLYLTNASHGKLINFRPRTVRMRFINATLDMPERRRFEYDVSGFSGSHYLRYLIRELVSDWGTGLDASLYRRAILHCSSHSEVPEAMLPMTSGNTSLGCQRFYLLEPDTALVVTTYKECKPANRRDFEKLIALSPLRRLHWLNIVHHHVCLTTIDRQ